MSYIKILTETVNRMTDNEKRMRTNFLFTFRFNMSEYKKAIYNNSFSSEDLIEVRKVAKELRNKLFKLYAKEYNMSVLEVKKIVRFFLTSRAMKEHYGVK